MADESEDDTPRAPEGPSLMKWSIAGGLAIFLGVLAAQVLAPVLSRMLIGDPDAVEEELAALEADQATDGNAGQAEVDLSELDPAIYVPLDPPMLASFEGADGQTRYLQMSIQAMGRSQSAMDAVRTHAPAIRNAFLFLMSNYSYEQVATIEGKEDLRKQMIASAREILRRNTGEPGVEEIYFTSLVLQ
jgi:flagellar FliL protein